MKVRTLKIDDTNERIPLIYDENDHPVDHLNYYIVNNLRGCADNTLKNSAYALVHIERFVEVGLIFSLQDEMGGHCFEDNNLYRRFIRHLERKSVKDFSVARLKSDVVEPDYFDYRIREAIKYLTYLHDLQISKRRLDDPVRGEVARLHSNLVTKLTNELIKDNSPSTRTGLELIQQASLFTALEKEGFCRWKKNTRMRNKLIVHLFYETGMRVGELAGLTIPNCHTRVKQPYIVTSQNVTYEDSRTIVPQEKTVARLIPISLNLAKMIEEYKKIRTLSEDAKKQAPYLFLTIKYPHVPLSIQSIFNIFSDIVKYIPIIKKLSPHILRHTFFENIDRHLNKLNYSEADYIKIKNYLGGWSNYSDTHKNYEKLSTQEQCSEFLTKFHQSQEDIHTTYATEIPF